LFHNKCIWIFLPHQDDEIFLWPIWCKILEASKVYIVFTTNGELDFPSKDNTRTIRNSEAIQNLTSSGIKKENIFFLADKLPGTDTRLHHYAADILTSMHKLADELSKPDCFIFPSCEGGHPDHDVTNLIVRIFGQKFCETADAYEFFLYALSNRMYRFNFARPDVIMADTLKVSFSRTEMTRVFRAMVIYRSQRRTFFLLGPGLIVRWLRRPVVYLKKADFNATDFVRPVNGNILYEKRKWTTFDEVRRKLEDIGVIKTKLT
jgi:LmbE family N-acetylglucosaminyl deacetylase